MELETRLIDFSRQAESDLKNLIISRGHKGTGNLLNSIRISVNSTGGGISLNIEVNDYIKYLDGGQLLKDFKTNLTIELKRLITVSITKDIRDSLKTR